MRRLRWLGVSGAGGPGVPHRVEARKGSFGGHPGRERDRKSPIWQRQGGRLINLTCTPGRRARPSSSGSDCSTGVWYRARENSGVRPGLSGFWGFPSAPSARRFPGASVSRVGPRSTVAPFPASPDRSALHRSTSVRHLGGVVSVAGFPSARSRRSSDRAALVSLNAGCGTATRPSAPWPRAARTLRIKSESSFSVIPPAPLPRRSHRCGRPAVPVPPTVGRCVARLMFWRPARRGGRRPPPGADRCVRRAAGAAGRPAPAGRFPRASPLRRSPRIPLGFEPPPAGRPGAFRLCSRGRASAPAARPARGVGAFRRRGLAPGFERFDRCPGAGPRRVVGYAGAGCRGTRIAAARGARRRAGGGRPAGSEPRPRC